MRSSYEYTGPLSFTNLTFLTRTRLATLLTNCFHDTRINTHSFRIGGASTMAAGLSDSTIMSLGRWSSNSYQVYLRLSDQTIYNMTRRMSETILLTKVWDSDVLQSIGHK